MQNIGKDDLLPCRNTRQADRERESTDKVVPDMIHTSPYMNGSLTSSTPRVSEFPGGAGVERLPRDSCQLPRRLTLEPSLAWSGRVLFGAAEALPRPPQLGSPVDLARRESDQLPSRKTLSQA
ncbi:hypothetical protein Bbelb_001280 [Branchiostoma belcheri]|nr:hypothetical protein Bbelb_001280 [Branchiostoma belcheri]